MKYLLSGLIFTPLAAFGQSEGKTQLTVVIFLTAIGVIILSYFLIREAVRSGSRRQVELLEKQNQLLTMLLNQQGVDKNDLIDIFITGKKDPWLSLKNHSAEKV
jgi:hypothetical protein